VQDAIGETIVSSSLRLSSWCGSAGFPLGKPMNEFVLNGLVSAGQSWRSIIERTHEAFREMVVDLESLDATIVQFDPDLQVETIKPKGLPPAEGLEQSGTGAGAVHALGD
jgi:hypothetical protein